MTWPIISIKDGLPQENNVRVLVGICTSVIVRENGTALWTRCEANKLIQCTVNDSMLLNTVYLFCSFGISLGMLLKHAFDTTTEGIYLRTRSDGRPFNLARLRAKTKVRKVLTRDMLFADDAAVVTHTQEELQSLMDCFSQACKDFGLTISLKKVPLLLGLSLSTSYIIF